MYINYRGNVYLETRTPLWGGYYNVGDPVNLADQLSCASGAVIVFFEGTIFGIVDPDELMGIQEVIDCVARDYSITLCPVMRP